MNLPQSPQSPNLLGILRRYARQAVLLHACLITALIFQPMQPFMLRADEPEEVWSDPVAQSILMAQMQAPNGTEYNAGDQVQVVVIVEKHSWLQQTSNFDNTNITDYTITPVSGATVTFHDNGTSMSGVDGTCQRTFTMNDAESTTISADVTTTEAAGSTSSSLNLTRYVETDPWTYTSSEAGLAVTLSAQDGITALTAGATPTLTVHVEYQTWDVYTDGNGETQKRNVYSSPAAGAGISWSVASGPGALSNQSGPQLNNNGEATVTYLMADQTAIVRADIEYNTSTTAAADLTFNPGTGETWHYDHDEGAYTTVLTATGGPNVMGLVADVTLTTWQVWISHLGNSQNRNVTEGPGVNAQVTFSIPQGDGSIGSAGSNLPVTVSADGNGRAETTFYMGAGASEVRAETNYSETVSTATHSFVPGGKTWTKLSDEQELLVDVQAASTTAASVPLSATLTYNTWEIWGNDQDAETRIQNSNSATAVSGNMTWSITAGNGSLVSMQNGSCTYNAASQVSVVTCTATFNGITGEGSIGISNLDTDGDGDSDADENANGTNPNDPTSGGGGNLTREQIEAQIGGLEIVNQVLEGSIKNDEENIAQLEGQLDVKQTAMWGLMDGTEFFNGVIAHLDEYISIKSNWLLQLAEGALSLDPASETYSEDLGNILREAATAYAELLQAKQSRESFKNHQSANEKQKEECQKEIEEILRKINDLKHSIKKTRETIKSNEDRIKQLRTLLEPPLA